MASVLGSLVGADEVALLIAMGLIVTALWPWVGQGALLVPGLVLLYLALPARTSFIARPPQEPAARRKG